MKIIHASTRGLAALLFMFLLVSCSGSGTQSGSEGGEPKFSGLWASEFEQSYKNTESDFAKKVLAKGLITEADYAEAQEAQRICLEESGFTQVQILVEDGISAMPPAGASQDEILKLQNACLKKTGLMEIEILYKGMQVNPNKEDFDALAVQCLIEQKVVERSFTKADLENWYKNEDSRLTTGPGKNCTNDPLRLTGTW